MYLLSPWLSHCFHYHYWVKSERSNRLENMSNHFRYATRIWFTSLISSPILLGLRDYWIRVRLHDYYAGQISALLHFLALVGYGVLVGGVVSLPDWLLLGLASNYIRQIKRSVCIQKLLIQACVIVLAMGLFLLLFGLSIFFFTHRTGSGNYLSGYPFNWRVDISFS